MTRTALAAALAATLCALAATAQEAPIPVWDDLLRPDDRERLETLNEAYGDAVRQAMTGGDRQALAQLVGALAGQPMAPDAAMKALQGDWRCRTMKLGNNLPLVVYDDFQCRVTGDSLEKLTGSQRVKGRIHPVNDQLYLLGVGYIADDTPPDYAALPQSLDPQANPQRTTNPGLVEVTGADHARIIFPSPTLESRMDVLELRR